MDWKWLNTNRQYDTNAGGDPSPPASPPTDQPSADPPAPAAPVPDPSSATGGGDGTTPPVDPNAAPAGDGPPAGAPAPVADPVKMPDAIRGVFRPEPTVPAGPPMATPAAPADPPVPAAPTGIVPYPDSGLAITDPDKYGQQMQAYIQDQVRSGTSAVMEGINRQGERIAQIGESLSAERVRSAGMAQMKAERAVDGFYANIFYKDKEFRSDPEIKALVQDLIATYADRAIDRAFHPKGDNSELENLAEAKFARRVLTIAKAERADMREGTIPFGSPLAGQQPPAAPAPAILEPEAEASRRAAEKDGHRYTPERIAAAMKRRGQG